MKEALCTHGYHGTMLAYGWVTEMAALRYSQALYRRRVRVGVGVGIGGVRLVDSAFRISQSRLSLVGRVGLKADSAVFGRSNQAKSQFCCV